jgi:hypothetical protein
MFSPRHCFRQAIYFILA